MKFTEKDWRHVADMTFTEAYPGYKPGVIESPNGDGVWDTSKEYTHIAAKYLNSEWGEENPLDATYLMDLLFDWVQTGKNVALRLGLPIQYWPTISDSTIRLLAYPPGAGTALHTDFDLFTLPMYRNIITTYEATFVEEKDMPWENIDQFNRLHIGELMAEINPHAYVATQHLVKADPRDRHQYSAVFFAMPSLEAVLPSGLTVSEWLLFRKARSRRTV